MQTSAEIKWMVIYRELVIHFIICKNNIQWLHKSTKSQEKYFESGSSDHNVGLFIKGVDFQIY